MARTFSIGGSTGNTTGDTTRTANTSTKRRERLQPSRRHRSTLRQLDRRALERAGWRTTLEFRENHVRLATGQLIDVETFWMAEGERDGVVISAAARSESRAWARLQAEARHAEHKVVDVASA